MKRDFLLKTVHLRRSVQFSKFIYENKYMQHKWKYPRRASTASTYPSCQYLACVRSYCTSDDTITYTRYIKNPKATAKTGKARKN